MLPAAAASPRTHVLGNVLKPVELLLRRAVEWQRWQQRWHRLCTIAGSSGDGGGGARIYSVLRIGEARKDGSSRNSLQIKRSDRCAPDGSAAGALLSPPLPPDVSKTSNANNEPALINLELIRTDERTDGRHGRSRSRALADALLCASVPPPSRCLLTYTYPFSPWHDWNWTGQV